MRSSQHKEIEVSLPDYDGKVRVRGVTYYPPCAATEIDPPEDAMVEYEEIFLEGRDSNVQYILSPSALAWIEERVMEAVEEYHA